MSKKILIDFEKSLDIYSGLGQFCLFLKNQFDKSDLSIEYFIPTKRKIYRLFPFLIPSSDVFHGIHQDSPYLPFFKSTKYILTIHDFNAIYENESEKFKVKYLKKLQKKVNRASIVTFISQFTFNEAQKYLKLSKVKTQIIYNGISLPNEIIKPSKAPTDKFFFTIGTVVPKKNFHVLIDMMEFFPEYHLIIAGSLFHKYANDMTDKIKLLKLDKRIFLIGKITNEEKNWYYKNAEAFLFPSLLEGFGLPVAEAMSLGTPLFLSNTTSLPEIGGSDANYFLNYEPKHMAEVITQGLLNFTDEKKQKLINRSKMFDWEKAAGDYLEIYKQL